jgi:non-canonical (house-cleaning) NTP pyrophosphatase
LEWSSMVKDDKGENTLWCMAWMAIYGDRRAHLVDLLASKDCKVDVDDDKTIFGLAKTGSFLLPTNLGKLIKEGMELGDADDKVFGRIKAKHGSGTVGLLTNGLIDRSAYYEHALILALVPWIRADVYA